jgi:hypothetical protein
MDHIKFFLVYHSLIIGVSGAFILAPRGQKPVLLYIAHGRKAGYVRARLFYGLRVHREYRAAAYDANF